MNRMTNLLSYVSSWWGDDPVTYTTIDADAHRRFMEWMAEPNTVKTNKARGWRKYTLDDLRADVAHWQCFGGLRKLHEIEAALARQETIH